MEVLLIVSTMNEKKHEGGNEAAKHLQSNLINNLLKCVCACVGHLAWECFHGVHGVYEFPSSTRGYMHSHTHTHLHTHTVFLSSSLQDDVDQG